MGNRYKWGVVTPHINKQIVEPVVTSLSTSIMVRPSYKFIKPQNDLTLCEHTI
jgi:hypothetical protein